MGVWGRGSVNGGTLTRNVMTSILIEYFIEYLSFCHEKETSEDLETQHRQQKCE